MDRLLRDLRFSLRSLLRAPVLSLTAAVSLALGIGAAASIFSAVDVFMIRPLDFEDSEDLVSVYVTNPERGWTETPSSWPDFADWRRESATLELAAYTGTGANLSGGDQPERLSGLQVSAGFLGTLRVRPQLGRGFRPEEEGPAGPRVVILSNPVWQRSFGADPNITERTMDLDGQTYQVVGVLPDRFQFQGHPDLLVPLREGPESERASRWLGVVGRIREGSSIRQARTEMASIQARIAAAYPDADDGNGSTVLSLHDDWFDEGFKQGSLISSVAVLFVLLIACANVANLLLARGAVRGREIALRGALGAGRSRILGQLLAEGVLLSLVGGALGVLFSVAGIRWIRGMVPSFFPRVDDIVLNVRVVAFTLVASMGSGILLGLAPALQGVRASLRDALSIGGRGGGASAGGRVRRSLVVAEISLSFVLLVSATLLVQAFAGLRTAELGYRLDHRVTAQLALSAANYPDVMRRHQFFREMEDRTAELPGVTAVALTSRLPMRGNNATYYTIPGEEAVDPARRPITSFRQVSPAYFDAMGIPLLSGRDFTRDDVEGAPRVLVVNRAFADRHWPGENPLGKGVEIDGSVREIVGLVGDTHDFGPDDDAPVMVYSPIYQSDLASASLVVKSDVAAETLISALREAMRELDPNQPLYSLRPGRELLDDELGGSSAMANILGAMAVLAFLLAAVGVYGVMAYSVAQRTQEVGIRMALGARAGDVRRMVLRQGGTMAVVGIGIGFASALAMTRFLAFFLYGVSPFDPDAFSGVTIVLLVSCLAASWIPALRATRVDPIVALRTE